MALPTARQRPSAAGVRVRPPLPAHLCCRCLLLHQQAGAAGGEGGVGRQRQEAGCSRQPQEGLGSGRGAGVARHGEGLPVCGREEGGEREGR